MKTFKVNITKSYIIKIKAEDANSAKEYTQYFTNNIKDISTEHDREIYKFQITDIDCKINDVFEVEEIK